MVWGLFFVKINAFLLFYVYKYVIKRIKILKN